MEDRQSVRHAFTDEGQQEAISLSAAISVAGFFLGRRKIVN
jgi:hypothetical protein